MTKVLDWLDTSPELNPIKNQCGHMCTGAVHRCGGILHGERFSGYFNLKRYLVTQNEFAADNYRSLEDECRK